MRTQRSSDRERLWGAYPQARPPGEPRHRPEKRGGRWGPAKMATLVILPASAVTPKDML